METTSSEGMLLFFENYFFLFSLFKSLWPGLVQDLILFQGSLELMILLPQPFEDWYLQCVYTFGFLPSFLCWWWWCYLLLGWIQALMHPRQAFCHWAVTQHVFFNCSIHLYSCVCARACVRVPVETRRRCQNPWFCTYSGCEPSDVNSGPLEEQPTLNHWAISLVPPDLSSWELHAPQEQQIL